MLSDAALKPTNVVFMAWRAVLNWDAVDGALTILNHAADSHRSAAHHRLDGRHPAEPREAGATARAVSARPLAARADTGAAHELMPIEKKYARRR